MTGLTDKFGGTATTEKKKSSVITVSPTGELSEQIEAYIIADRQTKDAKAHQDLLAVSVKKGMDSLRINESIKIGDNISSVKANGLTLSTKAMYSKIETDATDRLNETFGDQFSQYFVTKSEVKLGEDALEDEEFIEALVELAQKAGVSFQVKDWLQPTKAFHVARTLDENVRNKSEELEVIKPYAPSLKAA